MLQEKFPEANVVPCTFVAAFKISAPSVVVEIGGLVDTIVAELICKGVCKDPAPTYILPADVAVHRTFGTCVSLIDKYPWSGGVTWRRHLHLNGVVAHGGYSWLVQGEVVTSRDR